MMKWSVSMGNFITCQRKLWKATNLKSSQVFILPYVYFDTCYVKCFEWICIFSLYIFSWHGAGQITKSAILEKNFNKLCCIKLPLTSNIIISRYCQISNIGAPNSKTWMFLALSCSCLSPVHWSQVLSWEWRCSWSILYMHMLEI